MNAYIRNQVTMLTTLITLAALSLLGGPTATAQNTCDYTGGSNNWSDPLGWSNCGGSFPNNAGVDSANLETFGTVTLDQNITIQNLIISTTNITGDFDLTANGSMSWTGSAMSGAGTTRAAGGLELGGTALKDIQGTRSLINVAGQTANWTDGGLRVLNVGSTLINEATATFNILADGEALSGSGIFDNQGDVVVNLSDPGQAITISADFDNDGSLTVQQGRLILSGGGVSDGSYAGGADGVIEFGNLTHDLSALSSVTADNVEVTAGTVNVGGSYNVANTTLNNGSLNMDVAGQTGTLTQAGGAIGGDGVFTVTGQTIWNGGAMSGAGTTRAAGGLELGGTALKDIQGTRSLINVAGQTANWTDGGLRVLNVGSTLINEATATFNILADGEALSGSGIFDNQGDVVVNLSDPGQAITISADFDNDGSLTVQQGRLILSGGGSSDGSYAGGADGIIEFGNLTHDLSALSSVTADNVEVTAGTVNVGGSYNVANTTLNNGSLNMDVAGQTGTLTQAGGAIGGDGVFTVTGQTIWNGGAMSGAGTTRAEGGLELSTTGFKDIQGTRSLINVAGQTANWTDGGLRVLNTGSTLINEATATFNILADGEALSGSGIFDNQGDVVVNLSDPGQAITISADFDNDGSLTVQQGRLILSGGGVSDGSYAGGADGIIEFGNLTHDLSALSSVTADNVEVTAGTVNVGGSYNVANTTLNNGSLNMDVAGQTGTLTQAGGAIGGDGVFTVTGQTIWNGGAMSGAGTTRAEGGLELSTTGFKDIQGSRSLVNVSGQTANWTDGGLRVLNTGSTLINEATATFNILADGEALSGSGIFDNQGDVVVNLSDPGQAITISADFDNDGSLTVQQGRLILSGGGVSDGSYAGGADGIIEFGNLTHDLSALSSVTADNVEVTAGTVNVGGSYNVANTTLNNGSLNMDVAGQTGTLTQAGGAIGGDGVFTVTGQTIWNGGAMSGAGTTRAAGGLELGGTALKDIQGDRRVVNAATANWTDGDIRLLNTGSRLVNEANGTLNITTASQALTGSGIFENAGAINVNLQASDDVLIIAPDIQHDGSASVQNGILNLQNSTVTGSGSWDVNGGTLRVDSNSDVNTAGAVAVSNGGEIELQNNVTLMGSDLTMDPTAVLNAAGLNAELIFSGNVSFAMTDEAAWNLDDSASLTMTGGVGAIVDEWGDWATLELGGLDLGTDPDNNVGDPNGFIDNFSLPELIIGADAHIYLADLLDNGNRGGPQSLQEALYVDTLVFLDGIGQLNQNGLNLYFNTLIGDPSQIINTVVPIPAAVWLFGSGLVGLFAFRRRRTA